MPKTPNPTAPIRWDSKFENVLISENFQEKWNAFKSKVEKDRELCSLEFDITDFNDSEIEDLFFKQIDKFYSLLQDAIFKKLTNELIGKLRQKIANKNS